MGSEGAKKTWVVTEGYADSRSLGCKDYFDWVLRLVLGICEDQYKQTKPRGHHFSLKSCYTSVSSERLKWDLEG